MPLNQIGSSSTANVGTYNDVGGNQVNVQGDLIVHRNDSIDQDPRVHRELIRELKDILNPSNFTGDNRPQCLENTREHTLQSIYQWADAKECSNVLLLIGAANTGKSTIATTVAGKYQRRGQLGCHMFFLRERSRPEDVLPTIAYSLASYNKSIAESLVEKLKDSGDVGPSDLKTKFEILLRDPLSAVATKVRDSVLIVLDALDECGTPKLRQSLLKVFRDCLPSLPANFRVLITSRPEEDIASLIPTFLTTTLDQHSNESKANVSTYIKYEFDQIRSSGKLKVPEDCEWDSDLKTLADSADGLFIWASTAVRFVREVKRSRFRCFRNLVSNASSLKLDELYMTVLSHVSEWEEEDKAILRNIFSLILFAKHPLSDTEIDEILDVEMDTTSDLLSYFRSLVSYEQGKPITIYHTSFYDYLISCEGKPWYVDPDVQKLYLASRCFERMGNFLKHNICNISSDFVLNADVPDIDNRVTQYIPPFLKYICCNWIHHLRGVPYSQQLCSRLRSFVYKQLLFWFEILSLTNTFNRHAGPTLLFAIQWIGNNDPELSSFLRDAYRQASTYSEPISKSVLQIYASLLPLTKEESTMSIHYAKYANSAIRVEYIGGKQRYDCIKTIQVERIWDYVPILSFSPDGTRVLSSSIRGVSVWDATSGELIAGPMAAEDDEGDVDHERCALSAAYLPDGRYIVVTSRNGITRKWDLFTNCLVWERVMSNFQINTRRARSAAFSPNRKLVVFGYNQGTIRVWNVDTGEQDGESLNGHTEDISCLSFSPDGKYLASGSDDKTIIIWDVGQRQVETSPYRSLSSRLMAIDFSPCGTNVVSGSLDGTILVWNASTGDVLREIKCDAQVHSVTYSPDGVFILAGAFQLMSMWNVSDATATPKVFQAHVGTIERVSFSPDGSRFMSAETHRIQTWDASRVGETQLVFEEQRGIESISLSPSGEFIASGSYDGSIYLWNVLTGKLIKKLKQRHDVESLAFSPVNEQLIAFGSMYDRVQGWDVTKGEIFTIGNHESWAYSVVFSPDGNRVAMGLLNKTVCIWDVERGELAVPPLTGHTSSVYAVAYSPDGSRLVSGSSDHTVRIWNSETGQLLSTLYDHSESVFSVTYSFDGSRIVSGDKDGTILVWDAQSGQIVCRPIKEHTWVVKSVCFLLDGNRILSGSLDWTARVWDAITGNRLFPPFTGHTNGINSACFFPDGRRFATGSSDGTIRIWTLDTIPDNTNWELRKDNWVVGEDGKLMIWIPNHLHRYLCRPRNVDMIGCSFYFKLHFDARQNTK